MNTKLFDLHNGVITPSEHCYNITWLKAIMDEYKENDEYLKVYAYLFYMSCPNPELNPYFNTKEKDKEDLILEDLDADFSSEDEDIIRALVKCKKMYETPTYRAYQGIKKVLDKIGTYMENVKITDGKDGNLTQIARVAKDFDSIRESYKGVYKDLQDEQKSRVRGDKGLAYDQT